MTIYAGETVVWKTSALGVDAAETPLESGDVSQVLLTVVDTSDDSVLLTDGVMTFDATDKEWRYTWTTPGTAGRFTGKMRIVGGTFDVWETQKLKTKAEPAGF